MLFSERNDMTLCGGLIVDGELVPVYVKRDTGSVLYVDELNQEVLTIANMGCENPIEINSVEDITDLLKEDLNGCIGAILSEDCILAIKSESKLALVPLGCTLAEAEAELDIMVGVESTEESYEDLEEE